MPLSLLIKPASSGCNLSCKYCFYHDVVKYRAVKNFGIMTREICEKLIVRAFEFEKSSLHFTFQGGEPLLAGVKYFREFVELVKKHNASNLPVSYAVQTNGLCLCEEYCTFFKEHGFLVGVSIDGYKELHDYMRCGTYAQALKKLDLLKKYGVEFNVLCVVTSQAARHAKKVYESLKKNGFKYLQFIACINDFDGAQKEYSVSAEEYGSFLSETYSLYRRDRERGELIGVRLFDNLLLRLHGEPCEMCSLNGFCSLQFVVEADGSVYPCDFYAADAWRMGNIAEDDFFRLRESPAAAKFLREGDTVASECLSCEYYALCRGGCRRERMNGKNLFCQSFRALFACILHGR